MKTSTKIIIGLIVAALSTGGFFSFKWFKKIKTEREHLTAERDAARDSILFLRQPVVFEDSNTDSLIKEIIIRDLAIGEKDDIINRQYTRINKHKDINKKLNETLYAINNIDDLDSLRRELARLTSY